MQLVVDKIAKAFGIHEIFKNVSFMIEQGEHVGLVGVNGSGKTTHAKTFCEFLTEMGVDFVKALPELCRHLARQIIDKLVELILRLLNVGYLLRHKLVPLGNLLVLVYCGNVYRA